MSARRYFLTTILFTLLVFSLPALLVLVVDPFQVHHTLWIHKEAGFDATDRYQNAGLINSYLADPAQKIDTIIIGSSMSQNFPVAEMKNEQGVATLRLTLAGGSAKELRYILEKALQTGRVKKVIWEIHAPYTSPDPDQMHAQSPLPVFLYDRNPFNEWRYLYNNDVVEESFKLLKGKTGRRVPLDTLYTWTNESLFERHTNTDSMKMHRQTLQDADLPISQDPSQENLTISFPNVDQHLLPVLKAHPDVEFSLFFPPVSYFGMAAKGNQGFWKDMMMRRAVLQGVKDMPHVQVYAFDLVKGVGDTISVYQDVEHYRPWVNARMAKDMEEGKSQLKAGEWESYTRTLVRRVNRYVRKF